MSKVNLISQKPEHDLILKDRQCTLSPDKKGPAINLEMEQPILDINAALNRATNDPRSQARFLTMVKHACLDFKSSPITYNNNQLKQDELISINQKSLIKLQSILGRHGLYDEYFKAHKGKSFYLRAISDFVTNGSRLLKFINVKKDDDDDVSANRSSVHVPVPL